MKDGYIPFFIIGDDKPALIHVCGIPEGDYVQINGKWGFYGDKNFE